MSETGNAGNALNKVVSLIEQSEWRINNEQACEIEVSRIETLLCDVARANFPTIDDDADDDNIRWIMERAKDEDGLEPEMYFPAWFIPLFEPFAYDAIVGGVRDSDTMIVYRVGSELGALSDGWVPPKLEAKHDEYVTEAHNETAF